MLKLQIKKELEKIEDKRSKVPMNTEVEKTEDEEYTSNLQLAWEMSELEWSSDITEEIMEENNMKTRVSVSKKFESTFHPDYPAQVDDDVHVNLYWS